MSKQYRKIEFGLVRIENAVEELARYKDRGELVCGDFNGKTLYSDIDDLDSAYVKITGRTKAESDEANRIWREEYDRKKSAHEAAIPQLTKHYIEQGSVILAPEYHELWAKIIPVRLGDLYEGMELGASLEIIKALNEGKTLADAKLIIDEQGHSGMSYSLVRAMVEALCDRGEEFGSFVRHS